MVILLKIIWNSVAFHKNVYVGYAIVIASNREAVLSFFEQQITSSLHSSQ